VDKLSASKYLYADQNADLGEDQLPKAMSYWITSSYRRGKKSTCPGPGGSVMMLEGAAIDVIHYLSCCLGTKIPEHLLETTLGLALQKRQRYMKKAILSYVIYALAKGTKKWFKRLGKNISSLIYFEQTDCEFFLDYVVLLAVTISLKMDNEEDRNLTVKDILEQNLDSFARACIDTSASVWSVEGVQTYREGSVRDAEIRKIASGVEFNILHVYIFLAQGVPIADVRNWHVNPVQFNMLKIIHVPISPRVSDRASNLVLPANI
jgi:hypothetical protein